MYVNSGPQETGRTCLAGYRQLLHGLEEDPAAARSCESVGFVRAGGRARRQVSRPDEKKGPGSAWNPALPCPPGHLTPPADGVEDVRTLMETDTGDPHEHGPLVSPPLTQQPPGRDRSAGSPRRATGARAGQTGRDNRSRAASLSRRLNQDAESSISVEVWTTRPCFQMSCAVARRAPPAGLRGGPPASLSGRGRAASGSCQRSDPTRR